MKNFKLITASIVMGGVLLMSACGADTTKEIPKDKELLSIGEGSVKMQHILKEMEEGLVDKNTDEVIAEAAELDEVWEEFEDQVKENSKGLYDEAEKPLGTIKAGVKVKPFDEKTIGDAIEDLEGVLKDIEALDSTSDSNEEPIILQDGVKEMKEITGETKELLKEKDTEKITKEVNELDEVWESFEDQVKEKSKDLYDEAEKPLGVIKAGVKIEPLDDKTLNEALDNLNKVLDDIEKLK